MSVPTYILTWAGGKEKDRVTTQFCSTLNGNKCPPMIIFKAESNMFPPDGKMPRANTIAFELRSRMFSDGTPYPKGLILDCNPTAYALHDQLVRTVNEQMTNIPLPSIANCDDYKGHKTVKFKEHCESQHRYLYLTKGGLTPKFQIMDCAPNAIVHKYVTSQNMLRMLSAKKDSRGYPVSMNRVELARAVDQGWASVTPGLIMLCAVKCGAARVEDFEPAVVESEGLRTIHIDPIIADIVGAGIVPPCSELQELGALMGLDAEIEEDLEELEGVYSAMEELQDILRLGWMLNH